MYTVTYTWEGQQINIDFAKLEDAFAIAKALKSIAFAQVHDKDDDDAFYLVI